MLDENLKQQLSQYLGMLREPIELVASLGDDAKSAETRDLLTQIAALSDKVTAQFDGDDARKPSFIIRRASNTEVWVRFAGVPLGHEFTSMVLALLWTGGHPPKVSDEVLDQIRQLEGDFDFEMYFSLSCHNCPDVVQALTLMALYNPRITATLIEGGAFKDEVEGRGVLAVPAVFLNGEMWGSGKMSIEEILGKLDKGADARTAAKLADKKPFEVLVIGGGPAGASAAIYTARKGFSTGIAAERMGGQVMDTMGIENFISVPYTEGPKLAAALEQHVGEYDIDTMNLLRAEKLIPASEAGGYHEVQFSNGASLKARSLVLTTGARWRNLGVPGEAEYRTKGVAYCPHCDGPLFKGKRVAVIGGGNSGVEAAIDLANIVGHVTLIEFDARLRADQVLQDKLRSMKNVDILVSAQTTEVTGDGEKVNGLTYKDRDSGEEHHVELEGVFVQIGLVPNTEWLKDSGLEMTRFGEIVIDGKAATNLPGVFAAGDATTVPYKQIIIAMGEGSKAALSAFDYLIRNEAPEEIAQAAQAA
ncbi:alkyl hydroperoxide reductase subunit F [Novosphingobium pentaromativorans]|uniref:Thioredoxin reductase n=1 Tax=Novosphingobium pentaromativorans US6-1 TaxID=1088721 RepID=G6EAY9_9SPHN|nr:alkyl hydroperoxide reductase subunit F [Novosphingobium pentaromativorans]AIT80727.1 alkyl hydroperoxide reductase [Novosphingobium pentaromativorans US6-1]EHJ61552.1 alkyl hydroperoxide reductase, subunit F [Novosphingobium pentaromativorans US6-1]